MISLVIPTYNEADNIEKFLNRLFAVARASRLGIEVIVVDDSSPDRTADKVRKLQRKHKNLRLVMRKQKLDLASAVITGFRHAGGDVLGFMDADLSHPPDAIPRMMEALKSNDIVVGSRHIQGGTTSGWGVGRRLVSAAAILLVRPLTQVSDATSGFMLMKRDVIKGVELKPRGFKIGLEILVKGKHRRVAEVPYTFVDRKVGKTKLTIREYLNYIHHLLLLYKHKTVRG